MQSRSKNCWVFFLRRRSRRRQRERGRRGSRRRKRKKEEEEEEKQKEEVISSCKFILTSGSTIYSLFLPCYIISLYNGKSPLTSHVVLTHKSFYHTSYLLSHQSPPNFVIRSFNGSFPISNKPLLCTLQGL